MTREFKFRAWDKKKKQMMEVSAIHFNAGVIDLEGGGHESKDFEIMQYIGLKDKKRTEEYPEGQETYEEDIINTTSPFNPIGIVMYIPPKVFVVPYHYYEEAKRMEKEPWGMWPGKTLSTAGCVPQIEFVIIGNIYENPELLK